MKRKQHIAVERAQQVVRDRNERGECAQCGEGFGGEEMAEVYMKAFYLTAIIHAGCFDKQLHEVA